MSYQTLKRVDQLGGPFGPARIAGLAILTLVSAGAATPGFPDPGPLTSSSCSAGIVTLAKPGLYQLMGNLANCTVKITTPGVSFKLNGYTINPGGGVNDGIDVAPVSGRLNHVAIQGPGLITGANVGIAFKSTDYSQVALVTISNSSFGIYTQNTFVGDTVTFLTVGSNVVGHLRNAGIDLLGCNSCVVSGNDVSGNGAGINVDGPMNVVNNNTVNGNAGDGIDVNGYLSGTRVYGNVTNGNAGSGISVSGSGAQVFSNTSSRANGQYDLYDTNTSNSPSCLGNTWGGNVFQTSGDIDVMVGIVSPATCIH